MSYSPAVDGMRAAAVGAVIIFYIVGSLARGGFFGVDVFFVISGYLITGQLLLERAATGHVALGAFSVRRLLRLAPALVTTVAAARSSSPSTPSRWSAARSTSS